MQLYNYYIAGLIKKGDSYLSEYVSMSDDAAEIIARFDGTLDLRGLTSLSEKQAISLSKFKGEQIILGDLESISESTLGHICMAQTEGLSIGGAQKISENIAKILGGSKLTYLAMNILNILPDNAAKYLFSRDYETLNLTLKNPGMSDRGYEYLAKNSTAYMEYVMDGDLSDNAMKCLCRRNGYTYIYDKFMSDEAAKALAHGKGHVDYCELKSITDSAARILAKGDGEVSLQALCDVSKEAARLLMSKNNIHVNEECMNSIIRGGQPR